MKKYLLLAFLYSHVLAISQTVKEDTIIYNEVLPTELDNFGCYESLTFQVSESKVSTYYKVSNIRLIVIGETYGSVYPNDLELRLECTTTGLSVDRTIDNSNPPGIFTEFEDDIDVANNIYYVPDNIQFNIYAKRTYQENPANPLCGTEEALVISWMIIVEYFADDLDMDGFPLDEDCNDFDEFIYPGATEVCDGKDNNCDESIDNGAICENIFEGVSADWNNPEFWSLERIPTPFHTVIIPEGKSAYIFSTFPSSAFVDNLTIENGGQLSLNGSNVFLYYKTFIEIQPGGILNLNETATVINGTPF